MIISATPKRAILSHSNDDETELSIKCTATDDFGVLEIGKDHVFSSRKNRSFLSKRHACELWVRIKRRSSASETTAAKLSLSKDKIGELSFYPASKANEGTPSTPASLDAIVFLEDKLFDSVLNTLLWGKRPKWLQLNIEREETLRYGWEPDGSRKEWTIDNPSDPASVDITSIEMRIKLFQ